MAELKTTRKRIITDIVDGGVDENDKPILELHLEDGDVVKPEPEWFQEACNGATMGTLIGGYYIEHRDGATRWSEAGRTLNTSDT